MIETIQPLADYNYIDDSIYKETDFENGIITLMSSNIKQLKAMSKKYFQVSQSMTVQYLNALNSIAASILDHCSDKDTMAEINKEIYFKSFHEILKENNPFDSFLNKENGYSSYLEYYRIYPIDHRYYAVNFTPFLGGYFKIGKDSLFYPVTDYCLVEFYEWMNAFFRATNVHVDKNKKIIFKIEGRFYDELLLEKENDIDQMQVDSSCDAMIHGMPRELLKAFYEREHIESGNTGTLSKMQISNLITSLYSAKRMLKDREYTRVYAIYNSYQNDTVTAEMNINQYHDICMEIIDEYEKVAPYIFIDGNHSGMDDKLYKKLRWKYRFGMRYREMMGTYSKELGKPFE